MGLYEDEDQLFYLLKNLLTNQTKPLPKNRLQSINRHLDWKVCSRDFEALFEEVVNI